MTTQRPRNEQAIAVAQDVLAHLERLQPVLGHYLSGNIDLAPEFRDQDMQKHADAVQDGCVVCALGACLISYARLYDNVPLTDFLLDRQGHSRMRIHGYYPQVMDTLRRVFSQEQILLIEGAFEGFRASSFESENMEEFCKESHAAWVYGAGHRFSQNMAVRRRVLRDIMENIVANDGWFIPSQLQVNNVGTETSA